MGHLIALSVDSKELEKPLLAAMAIWNSVDCGQSKLVLDPQSRHRVILRQKTEWSFEPKVLAMTLKSHSEVSIEVNQADKSWTALDYQNVLVHELGHVLGLEHSEEPRSVMHPIGRLGRTQIGLSEADKINFCALEPEKPQTGCTQTGFSSDLGLFSVMMFVLLCHRKYWLKLFAFA